MEMDPAFGGFRFEIRCRVAELNAHRSSLLVASLAGASLASGGGPRRRDTATGLGGPYAAFGPAAAAFPMRPEVEGGRLVFLAVALCAERAGRHTGQMPYSPSLSCGGSWPVAARRPGQITWPAPVRGRARQVQLMRQRGGLTTGGHAQLGEDVRHVQPGRL